VVIDSGELVIYRPAAATAAEFVSFWSPRYQDPREDLYTLNVDHPPTPERVMALFFWKNGGALSARKRRSVEENYIARAEELAKLPRDLPASAFLDRFPAGGAIWRIFWLHCWQPHRFPIFDLHVHRAMRFIQDAVIEELDEVADDRAKVRLYLDHYLPFHGRFAGLGHRETDRALWTFGKFIKAWRFPSVGT
jgi:hypothetical protein